MGISFLARSVLCWLPPLLAALELRGRDPLRRRLARAALLLALPFLFLLPWVRYDRVAVGRGALFDNRADWNMVTGALGIVGTVEADYRKLAGLEPGESAPRWAARRIAARPAAYLSGVARRAAYIFSLYPLTLCLWASLLLLLRRREDFLRANLLPAYFLAVHTAFSVEPRYLAPVMPLLAALCVSGLFALLRPGPLPQARREAAACFAAGAALPALLALYCCFLLLRHPGAGSRPAALRAAASARPGEQWLKRELGRQQLEEGDYAGAYASLAGPAAAYPENMSVKVDLAAAALLRNRRNGRPGRGADLIARLDLDQPGAADHAAGKQYVLRALYELEAGRPAAAAESARLARLERRRIVGFIRRDDGADEELLHSYDAFITGRFLPELLRYFPAASRRRLCGSYVRLHEKGGVSAEAADAWCASMLRAKAEPGSPLPFRPRDFAARSAAGSGAYLHGTGALAAVTGALAEAGRQKKRVLLEVGGEWCSWCAELERTFARSGGLAAYRDRRFVTVRIYSPQTGAPPQAVSAYPPFSSLPHIYVLGPDGRLLASQTLEEFEAGDTYSPAALLAFLRAQAGER